MRAVASSVVSFALALTLQAQQARDQNRIVLSGTASLSGLVTEADGKTPVRRAHVTSSRAGVNDSRLVSTDERGRYVFDALPSGLYIVSVTKGAYLRTAAGAIRPGYAGQQIVVRDGEAAVAPAVALWRGGVLAGRIVNAVGDPVRGAQVFAAPVRVDGGTRGLKRVSDFDSMFSGVTNDHGDYRIYGLPPDSYVISAYTPPQMLADTSATELTWFVKPSPGTPPPAPRTFQYAPTLHPSVTDWQRATLVTLKQGEERLDLQIALQRVPLARITGLVVSPDNQPVAGASLSRRNDPSQQYIVDFGGPAQSRSDGTFTIAGVQPGGYAISVRGSSKGAALNVPFSEAQRMGVSPTAWDLWGRASVTVNGADITGVTIQLQPTVAITGRFDARVADGRPVDLTRARVELRPAAFDAPSPSGMRYTVLPDRTFRIEGVVPGQYKLWAILPGQAGLTLRSAMLGGRDVIDVPFEVSPGADTTGIVVAFTDTTTEISGRITHASGEPASHLHVFAFPQNRAHQFDGSRRFASMRTRADGSYSIDSLPPGDYFLCALTELDPSMQYDPDFLNELAKASIRITLGEGEKKVQDLRIASPSRR